MTASFNSSVFNTAYEAEKKGKKVYRSIKLDNYSVEVVDFDNEIKYFDVEAVTPEQASEMAEQIATQEGLQVNYCNVYKF